VVYRRNHTIEDGVITSFNADYVFVRYGGDRTAKATLRSDLDWCTELPAASRASHFS
jgi:hypothetical protein